MTLWWSALRTADTLLCPQDSSRTWQRVWWMLLWTGGLFVSKVCISVFVVLEYVYILALPGTWKTDSCKSKYLFTKVDLFTKGIPENSTLWTDVLILTNAEFIRVTWVQRVRLEARILFFFFFKFLPEIACFQKTLMTKKKIGLKAAVLYLPTVCKVSS